MAVVQCSHTLFASQPGLLLQAKVQSHVIFSNIYFIVSLFPVCTHKATQARLADLDPANPPLPYSIGGPTLYVCSELMPC